VVARSAFELRGRRDPLGQWLTNRWTGATGSAFRIKRDPVKLLGNAVARSTQPFGGFAHGMTRILLLVFILTVSGTTFLARGQHPTAKFDHFGDICCEDEKARLDNFVVALQNEPNATGYIVYYGGRHLQTCGSKRTRRPLLGEAQARAARLKPYVANAWRGFDPKRVVVINGGYRESWEAELWIVPPGQQPPSATPTLKPSAIKFRRGRARARDFRCEV
jgi:hypothetical protein